MASNETERCVAGVHCVQSFVGVQLILALDAVRQAAIRAGHSVGPVVIMSYKNHALDEILLDVSQVCVCARARTGASLWDREDGQYQVCFV